MPNNTSNLGLYKKNPSTDGNDTFDINTMLNDNWDRIDSQLGAQLSSLPATQLNLSNGLQVVNAGRSSPYSVQNIVGRTLVNLLGRDGNCEDVSKASANGANTTLDSMNKTIGNNGFKVTSNGTYAWGGTSYFSILNRVDKTKYYIMLADIKNGNATSGKLSCEIQGGTGRDSNVIAQTSSFSTSWLRIQPSDMTGATAMVLHLYASGANGQYVYYDGVRIYEITQAEYTAAGSMTAAQIAAKYPYVDDVKHVNAPYVIKYGENLLPTFNEWALSVNAVAVEPYKYSHNAAAGGEQSYVIIPVVANTDYYLSFSYTGNIQVGVYNADASAAISAYTTASRTFNSGNNTQIRIYFNTTLAGVSTVSNLMLNLGSTAKPFKPRNDDQLFFPNVQLASSVDGTVYDQIFKRDGKWLRENRFVRDMVLDGSLSWVYGSDFVGYKQIQTMLVTPSTGINILDQFKVVKYDGKILETNGLLGAADRAAISSGDKVTFSLGIADTDSGWGETYTPTTQEIKAYFYGWKMYDGANGANQYTGGTKSWCYRLPTGGYTGGTNNLPTSYAPMYGTWSPYKLTYQLATPTFEEIQVDGGMSLHEGLNQIEVGQGVIVREKANPQVSLPKMFINASSLTSSWLKNKPTRILAIYMNGLIDKKWTIYTNDLSAYGAQTSAGIAIADYDPTATYEVSYIALDQYLLSSSVPTVNGEYASNLKTVVDAIAQGQADNEARIAANKILARQIYNVPQKSLTNVNMYVDGTNGSDSNDGSAGKPLKTIMAAVNRIPQVVNHNIYIYLADGTYSEDLTIWGYSGSGEIRFFGNSSAITNVKINSISAMRNTCYMNFSYIQFIGTAAANSGGASIFAYGCTNIVLASITTTNANAYGLNIMRCFSTIDTCTFSNKTSAGILAQDCTIVCTNCGGSGNAWGIYAIWGSSRDKRKHADGY